ncbi:MAG TPA: amino acid adenylation domain-containing protein, partial [Candidatus Angelobacter sp.]
MKPSISMEDVYELSPLQAGMLFDSVYGAERPMYVVQLQLAISGEVNVTCLSKAWQRTAQRHPILRTSFHWRGLGKPAQVVHSARKAAIEMHDLRSLDQASQTVEIQKFCDADRARGFDLSRAPLARLSLLHLGQETWRLVWTFHHLIMDGWSWSPVLQEFFLCYDALCRGQEPSLPEVVPYRDYIRWLRGQDHDAAETFWKKSLQGVASPARLNEDLVPAPDTLAPQFGERWITYDKESAVRWSRKFRVTLSTLTMGAWALLLGRLTENNDVLFGNVVSGRPADLTGIESIIGPTINTVPTRIRMDQSQTVLGWLRDLQKSQAAARCFDYSQISDIRRWAKMPAEQPLFHTTFVFENYPMSFPPGTKVAGLEISPLPMAETPNQSFMVEADLSRELAIHFVYDSGRFSEAAVKRIAAQYKRLLHQMVTSPEAHLSELDWMDESEREQVLVEWNRTQEEFPDRACIHELFESQARLSPERVAVIFENASVNYGELNRQANQLANYLNSLGVGAETLVGVCMERRPEMIVGLLAILKAGGAYVPLDPSSPKERRSLVVRTARLELILSDQKFSREFEGEETRVVSLDRAEAEIKHCSDQNLPPVSLPENLAYVMFTSGSTGIPKGVQIAHRSVINCLHSFRQRIVAQAEDTVVALTSLSFDIAALELFLPLLMGARVLLTRGAAAGAKELASQLNSAKEMIVQATPSTFRLLLQAGWQGGGPLKLLCGGEALDPQLARELALRGEAIWNVYGPTETTIWSTCHPIRAEEEHVSLGRPIGNTQLFVLDGEMLPVPVGMRGELFIAGAGLARGYLNRPDLTAERFLSNPFSAEDGARMYRTGDLVRYEKDGNLEFLGRVDYQVKIRGHRIELEEIEAVLRLQKGVQDGVVVVREDTAGDKRLVAFVVWESEETFSESELRTQLKKSFPEYMVPTAIVRLEQMPLTPNGKVDRKSLPATELARPSSVYRGPQTPAENALAGIWEEVLGLKRISIDDNFFDLGGHSLLAMKVISRVWEVFHCEVPLRLLFANPSIAGFVAHLHPDNTPRPSNAGSPIIESSTPQPAMISFAQERMWFMEQLEPGSALYNVPIALRLRGKLHTGAVENALQQIVERHEA